MHVFDFFDSWLPEDQLKAYKEKAASPAHGALLMVQFDPKVTENLVRRFGP